MGPSRPAMCGPPSWCYFRTQYCYSTLPSRISGIVSTQQDQSLVQQRFCAFIHNTDVVGDCVDLPPYSPTCRRHTVRGIGPILTSLLFLAQVLWFFKLRQFDTIRRHLNGCAIMGRFLMFETQNLRNRDQAESAHFSFTSLVGILVVTYLGRARSFGAASRGGPSCQTVYRDLLESGNGQPFSCCLSCCSLWRDASRTNKLRAQSKTYLSSCSAVGGR